MCHICLSVRGGGERDPQVILGRTAPRKKFPVTYCIFEINIFLAASYGLKYYKSAKKWSENASTEAKIQKSILEYFDKSVLIQYS